MQVENKSKCVHANEFRANLNKHTLHYMYDLITIPLSIIPVVIITYIGAVYVLQALLHICILTQPL